MGIPVALPDPLTPASRPLFGLAGLATTGISGDLTLTKAGTTARTVTFPDAAIEVQGASEVRSSGNFTARLGAAYAVTATATVTDPTPAEGREFTSLVRNGTATIGGKAYATAGALVVRSYHSGSWNNFVYPHLAGAWTWTAAQAFLANGSHFFGVVATTGLTNVTADGGNSGTNGGASYFVRGNGATTAAFGNFSSILGGAYDARTTMYSAASNIVFQHGGTTSATLDTSGIFALSVAPATGNGLLQLASGTTRANGIWMGDFPIFRAGTGVLAIGDGTTAASTQTTVGAAGGASALPATPTGYLRISISGTIRKIPFYAD